MKWLLALLISGWNHNPIFVSAIYRGYRISLHFWLVRGPFCTTWYPKQAFLLMDSHGSMMGSNKAWNRNSQANWTCIAKRRCCSTTHLTQPCKGPGPQEKRVWIFFLLNMYIIYMGVSKNRGIPKWMVKLMEKPLGGTIIFGNIHIIPQKIYLFSGSSSNHLRPFAPDQFSSKTWPFKLHCSFGRKASQHNEGGKGLWDRFVWILMSLCWAATQNYSNSLLNMQWIYMYI